MAGELLRWKPEATMLKKWIIPAAIASVAITGACKIEKTGRDTYSVQAPTAEAKAAAQKASAKTEEAGKEINEHARKAAEELKPQFQEAGKKLKEGARTAAEKTGEAMQQAGKSMQDHAEEAKKKP